MPDTKSHHDIGDFLITAADTIRSTMAVIEKTGSGIALVVDEDRHLVDTVTDGDIRRALMEGYDMAMSIRDLLDNMPKLLKNYGSVDWTHHPGKPLTARIGSSRAELLDLMTTKSRRHIPLIDEDNRVVDIALWDELAGNQEPMPRAVVMAGGLGSRLNPLTEDTPKTMLPVGDRPLMEHIIDQFREAGIHHVNVSVRHLKENIISHFGDGSRFGVSLDYIDEEEPLGTAGALRNLANDDETLLVINGDILTRVDFLAMVAHHRQEKAALTVAVRKYELAVPYGVVKCQGNKVTNLEEKPKIRILVNAGVYLVEPAAKKVIPSGKKFDMTDLIQLLLDSDERVSNFLIHEYWLDVGQPQDYQKAQKDFKVGKFQ